jgi:hypothetical protein
LKKFTKEVGEPFLGEEAKQRPDIQYRVNISEENGVMDTWKFIIVEISVRFGKGDRKDEQEDALKRIIDFKTNKYELLVRSLKFEDSFK